MHEDEYEAGKREGYIEGRLNGLGNQIADLKAVQEHHEARLRLQERITFGLLGAIALAQFMPTIREIMQNAGG